MASEKWQRNVANIITLPLLRSPYDIAHACENCFLIQIYMKLHGALVAAKKVDHEMTEAACAYIILSKDPLRIIKATECFTLNLNLKVQ